MAWYGNWAVVVASILFFTLFVVGFAYAPKKHDWKTLGIYEAFMVALFTEMEEKFGEEFRKYKNETSMLFTIS